MCIKLVFLIPFYFFDFFLCLEMFNIIICMQSVPSMLKDFKRWFFTQIQNENFIWPYIRNGLLLVSKIQSQSWKKISIFLKILKTIRAILMWLFMCSKDIKPYLLGFYIIFLFNQGGPKRVLFFTKKKKKRLIYHWFFFSFNFFDKSAEKRLL
jgi:hypothetical protein